MDLVQKYRLRVENCIGTIIDVHKSVSIPYENDNLLSQFEKLRNAVNRMDMALASEGDIVMVEKATNALLGEFRSVFESGVCGPVYHEQAH